MKTSARPSRRKRSQRFATRPNSRSVPPPANLPPPLSFTVQDFKDGRSITYTLTREGYVFQVAGDAAVRAETSNYPKAAAKARAMYQLPPIGSASYGLGGMANNPSEPRA
jgi:hypothetical protein